MRVLIADDELSARALLREYLTEEPDTEVVAECSSGREATRAIREHAPALVFLDVEMPGVNGFDIMRRLSNNPPSHGLPEIIFSTTHDEYISDALEAGATDYLLKPYSRPRFQQALERVRKALGQGSDGANGRAPSARMLEESAEMEAPEQETVEEDAPDPGLPTVQRLFVRAGSQITPINTNDISWIEGTADHSKLHTSAGTYPHGAGIGALAERLDTQRFLPVSPSAIVALDAIEDLSEDGRGGYVITVRTGQDRQEVRVSADHARDLSNMLA